MEGSDRFTLYSLRLTVLGHGLLRSSPSVQLRRKGERAGASHHPSGTSEFPWPVAFMQVPKSSLTR